MKRVIAGVVLALVAAVVPVSVMASPAEAGTSTAVTSTVSDRGPVVVRLKHGGPQSFTTDWGWFDVKFYFNKTETYTIAAISGGCSVVVGKLPSVYAKVASGACGLLAVMAGYYRARGQCLGLRFGYNIVSPSMTTFGHDRGTC